MKDSIVKTVRLRGIMKFYSDFDGPFKGLIKKGLRPIVWYKDINKGGTSCSILSDVNLLPGDTREVEIVLLNELQLDELIKPNMKLDLGTSNTAFAEFIVLEHLGEFIGRVP